MKASILLSDPLSSDHQVRRGEVHDLPAEHGDEFPDLGPFRRRRRLPAGADAGGGDLHQHQVAVDQFGVFIIQHADDGDDLFELLADLVQHAVVAVDHERHPAEPIVLRGPHAEGIDIEGPAGEHPRDVRPAPPAGSSRGQTGRDAWRGRGERGARAP